MFTHPVLNRDDRENTAPGLFGEWNHQFPPCEKADAFERLSAVDVSVWNPQQAPSQHYYQTPLKTVRDRGAIEATQANSFLRRVATRRLGHYWRDIIISFLRENNKLITNISSSYERERDVEWGSSTTRSRGKAEAVEPCEKADAFERLSAVDVSAIYTHLTHVRRDLYICGEDILHTATA